MNNLNESHLQTVSRVEKEMQRLSGELIAVDDNHLQWLLTGVTDKLDALHYHMSKELHL